MVIRQVLTHLQNENIVNVEPYRGATVARMSSETIMENYQILGVLEGYAAGLAASNISHKDIDRLKKILENQKNLTEDKEDRVDNWQILNHEYHRIINIMSKNNRLVELIEKSAQFTTFWFLVLSRPGRLPHLIVEHEAIIAALEKRDIELSRKLMEDHIIKAGVYLVENICDSPVLRPFIGRNNIVPSTENVNEI
jgi:DNA-binding GntR family transcriptional regulator